MRSIAINIALGAIGSIVAAWILWFIIRSWLLYKTDQKWKNVEYATKNGIPCCKQHTPPIPMHTDPQRKPYTTPGRIIPMGGFNAFEPGYHYHTIWKCPDCGKRVRTSEYRM